MIREIVLYGHPALRAPGARVTEVTEAIRALAADMIDTVREAKGVGLAAQQVGEAVQLFVLDVPQMEERPSRMWIDDEEILDFPDRMPLVLINPEVQLGKETEIGPEGCLSFPELHADIRRATEVTLSATDLDGNPVRFRAEGLLARAVQHETDHLKGVLFIDRMNAATKLSLRKDIERLKRQTAERLAS